MATIPATQRSGAILGRTVAPGVVEPPMPLSVVELNQARHTDWAAFVERCPEGTFFHSLTWMKAVRETFGHEPTYLMAYRGRHLEAVLPIFEVRSWLAGKLLVSVPYGVYGGAVGTSSAAVRSLLRRSKDMADSRGVRLLDLRSTAAADPELGHVDRYVTFRRQLPDSPEDVQGMLPRKARAAARKARDKIGLRVDFSSSDLRVVWDLYSQSMRRLGSLNYPYRFFERLVAETPAGHLVTVVRHEGRPVAGLLSFFFRDTVLPYIAGCASGYEKLCANNLMYLATMQRGVEMGYRVFDFGRSRKDNTGSYNFKRFNGFEPVTLGYQTYVPSGKRSPDLSPSNRKFSWARLAWRRLPLWATRPMGAWIARSIPG